MHVAGFANPWEHTRLLSDAPRNQALLDLLARHAPGKRVLEVGCGTGLLSLAAARLGATRVHAVEPTRLAEVARELVRHNALDDRIVVHEAAIEDLPPERVDLAFFELLNADPFVEGIVQAAQAANAWLAPGGMLAPSHLTVRAALCAWPGPAAEAAQAQLELHRIARDLGLSLEPLAELLRPTETSKEIGIAVPISKPVDLWTLTLGEDELPEDEEVRQLTAHCDAEVGGVMIWFEARLDDGLVLTNGPGRPGHWSQLICGLSEGVMMREGDPLNLAFELDDDELEVRCA